MARENTGEDSRLALLRAQAEREMRRRLPGDDGRPSKRRKGAGGAAAAADVAADDDDAPANGGRFDYGAVQELGTGIAGFLLTCPLQRENSARKEAAPLLQHYLQQCTPSSGAANDVSGSAGAAAGEAASEGQDAAAAGTPVQLPSLAAIKLACRGVVAFKVAALDAPAADSTGSPSSPSPAAAQVQAAVAALLRDIASGAQARLRHVQRIIPVQASCQLEPAGLRAAGQRLAAQVASAAAAANGGGGGAAAGAASGPEPQEEQRAQRRLTFGIAVKHRCSEGNVKAAPAPAALATAAPAEAAADAAADAAAAPAAAPVVPAAAGPAGMDRGGIIAAVAAGFEQALREAHSLEVAVDLKAPDWVLVVEVVPAGGALYAALCAVPRQLCVLKPKLHIQPVGKA